MQVQMDGRLRPQTHRCSCAKRLLLNPFPADRAEPVAQNKKKIKKSLFVHACATLSCEPAWATKNEGWLLDVPSAEYLMTQERKAISTF